MEKSHIIAEIKRTAAENDGVPLGIERFQETTGIRKEDWYGVYWARWSDAQKEAGLKPNEFGVPALEVEWMLEQLTGLIKKLGHFPTKPELKLEKRSNPQFPNHVSIARHFGRKRELVLRTIEFCQSRPELSDVEHICAALLETLPAKTKEQEVSSDDAQSIGHVYLLKCGKVYKIGRSIDASRRYKEIRTQMPYKTEEIHVIETDDPVGIEAYWHNRFKEKRLEGEWFELSSADVKAFRKRKFM